MSNENNNTAQPSGRFFIVCGDVTDAAGNDMSEIIIEIINPETNETLTVMTDGNGTYSENLANFHEGWEDGEEIIITVIYCESDVKSIYPTSNDSEIINFVLPTMCAVTNFTPFDDGYQFSNTDNVCYGMSETSILFYERHIYYYRYNNAVDKGNEFVKEDVRNLINIHQGRVLNKLNSLWLNIDFISDYYRLKDYLKSDDPVMMLMQGKNNEGTTIKHAVVAYKLVEYDNFSRIFLYDPNFPNEERIAYYTIDTQSFEYGIYDKFIVSGAKTLYYEKIDAFYDLIDTVKEWYSEVELILNVCPTKITITAKDGNISGYRDEIIVNEIPNVSVIVENDIEIYIIPFGVDYTITVRGIDQGNYNLVVYRIDGSNKIFNATNISIQSNELHVFTINWSQLSHNEKGVNVTIDLEGDGIDDYSGEFYYSFTQYDYNTTTNEYPNVVIVSIVPNESKKGEVVRFQGNGSDDGKIVRYLWVSNLDGEIYNGTKQEFSYSNLSIGNHTIILKVQDDFGVWSSEVITYIIVRDNEDNEDFSELILTLLGLLTIMIIFIFLRRKGLNKLPDIKTVDSKNTQPFHTSTGPSPSSSVPQQTPPQPTPVTSIEIPIQPNGNWMCPKCEKKWSMEEVYCGKCGTIRQKTWKCPSCGIKVDNINNFCTKCGTQKIGSEMI